MDPYIAQVFQVALNLTIQSMTLLLFVIISTSWSITLKTQPMNFNLSQYESRNHNKSVDITHLPRQRVANSSTWKVNTRVHEKKLIPQPITCSPDEHCRPYHKSKAPKNAPCFECHDFLRDATKYMRLSDDYKEGETTSLFRDVFGKPYHALSREQQLHYLSRLVHWELPAHSTRRTKALNGDYGKNRYPQTFRFEIDGMNGFGRYIVCGSFLRHLLSVAHKHLYNRLSMIWISRRDRQLLPVWIPVVDTADSESEDDETDVDSDDDQSVHRGDANWTDRFDQFVCSTYNLQRAHYVNAPNQQSHRVYFETVDGEEVSMRSVYWKWIEVDQPMAWNYHKSLLQFKEWECTDGAASSQPTLLRECFPKPCVKYALRVIKKTFNVGMKRVGKDVCPIHGALCSRIRELELSSTNNSNNSSSNDTEIADIKRQIVVHEQRANDVYDIVHHAKQNCSHKVYAERQLDAIIDTEIMKYPGKAIHLEFDYDHSRPELELREQGKFV